MTKERKISIICHGIAVVVLIILLGLATKYDLAISKAIGDKNSFFGQFFAVFAEYPSYLVLPFCGVIVFYNYDMFQKKNLKIVIKVLGAILSYVGWFVFATNSTKLVEVPHITAFAISSALIFGTIGLIIGSAIKRDTMHRLFKFSVFAITVTLVSLVVMQLMKLLWSRMRYRDMLLAGNCDGFTPWYQIMAGKQDGATGYDFTSFPSGHSSSIVHLYLLCVLCDIVPSLKKAWIKPTMYSIITITCIVGTISRIVNCAHFLSDIIVGAGITYLIFWLLKFAFFNKTGFIYNDKKMSMTGEELTGEGKC